MTVKTFTAYSEANEALKAAISAGHCESGYIAERFNVGALVYTVHCRKGGYGWAL